MTGIRSGTIRAFASAIGALFVCTAQAQQPYLDDANTRQPSKDASLPSISQHGFPRTLAHELSNGANAEAYSKYHFIDAHGFQYDKFENVQANFSPDTMMLRHIGARDYQSYTAAYCKISGGVAFEATTAASQGGPVGTGCGIYAGHWLYEAGTKLRAGVNASATTLQVEDASRFTKNHYIVIYDAPAGSFNNAEHARVTAINVSNQTITVERGYKSNSVQHAAGSIVAPHVLGQGTDPRLWAWNFSSVSPRDGNNKTFGEFYADWLGKNWLRHKTGETTTADIAGILFDTDFYFDLKSKKVDTNNDLVTDHGISSTGENWLGAGLDAFYARVRQRIPGKYIMAGVHEARGYASAQGTQVESWLDYGNGDFQPNPKYKKLSELFTTYLFNMAERDQGPALVHNLTKTPTKLYPGNANPAPTSNAPFRLGLAMTLMEDGYFGTHSKYIPDAWWDEYAVDVVPGSPNFGKAIAKNNVSAIHTHRGWLGQPLGKFSRIYDDTQFAPAKSLLANGTFDSNLQDWRAINVTINRVTSGQQDGAGAMRVSGIYSSNAEPGAASVKSQAISIQANKPYTVAFSARAANKRAFLLQLGNAFYHLPISDKWRRYVVTLTPTQSATTRLVFALGQEFSNVWLDSVYLFNGDANVFQREFENGLVLANASEASVTIPVGSGFQRIDGTQDRLINNGNSVNSVTLAPYDGIVLVRSEGTPPPPPPSSGGTGKIGNYVWQDLDGDGVQDSSEPGLAGSDIRLMDCDNNQIAATTSDANGIYMFEGLDVGSYMIRFVAPDAYDYSPPETTSGGADSNPDPSTGLSACLTMAEGQSRIGIDAGFVPKTDPGGNGTGRIGDFVWVDLDGNGLQGASEKGLADADVRLLDCNNSEIAATRTDANGRYMFEGLDVGSYMIRFVAPAGHDYSPPETTGSGWGSNADPATGLSSCLSMADGQSRIGIDAGFVPSDDVSTGQSSMGDFVWEDLDRDGIQDANEPGVGGVAVRLRDCNGVLLQTTTTAGDGSFSFDQLAAGRYVIQWVAPAGMAFTKYKASGFGGGKDSNAYSDGFGNCFNLSDAFTNRWMDAGLISQ